MFNRMIQKTLENSRFILFIFLCLGLLGGFAAKKLPIDAVPDITPTQVIVNTKTEALDPEQIEKTVTYYIETEMAAIPNIDTVRSLSRFGLSQVVITFKEGTNIYLARQLVSERIQNIKENLPNGLNPEMGPISTGLGEIVLFTVLPKNDTNIKKRTEKEWLLYLRTVTDFLIRPYLKANIRNIADVDVIGGYKKQVHIDILPDKLLKHGISVNDILEKLEGIGENFGGGYIQRGGKQIIVRTNGMIENIETLEDVPIRLGIFGRPVLLKDVAIIREDHMERVGAATFEGKETVIGAVFLLMGENSREVALESERVIQEIPLPSDVKIKVIYSRAFLVNETIKTVITNLSEGAILVILILLLVIGNFRASLLVSIAIPACMLYTLIAMYGINLSANLISLGAIDFGLLVDGSVVIVENVMRKLQENINSIKENKDKIKIIKDAVVEVYSPVTYGLLIVIGVYIPILALEGIEGKMFRPMASSVIFALGFSLIVAIILMPSLSYLFIKVGSLKKEGSFIFRMIEKAFEPILHFILKFKLPVVLLALVFAFVCIFTYSRMGSDFIPPLDEGDMSLGLVRNSNISLKESLSQQKKIEVLIKMSPEVISTYARTGTAESATDPMGVNMSDTYVILNKDKDNWRDVNGRRITKYEIFQEIQKRIETNLPEQEIGYTQPIELRFNEILEGSRADISLRIYGKSLEKLLEYQERAKEILEEIPGASTVELDAITALRKGKFLDIKLDYTKINLYGLALHDVNMGVKSTMRGIELGSFYEFDWRFPIVLRLAEEYRNDPKRIASIPVSLPEGGSLSLNELTSIKNEEKVSNIARAGSRRYAAVAVNLQGRDVLSYVEEAKRKVSKGINLSEGYYFYWGGQFRNLQKARARLAIIIPITLIGIFFFIYRSFGNIVQAILVFFAIPFAMTGGILSLYFRGMNLNISASIGFIALMGIGILDSMVLVSFFNDLRKKGMSVREAVKEGTLIRLRPVITTSVVAGLGFIPMAFNTGMGAEVQRPLATVVIGGLITSTSLTLILLPILYDSVESFLEKRRTT